MATIIDAAWLAARTAPYKLETAGETYVLGTNVTTDGIAFLVCANGITLDLAGYTITYGNRTPVVIPNGDFETTDFTGWDLTNAPSFSRVAASEYAHGSYMLQGTISAAEYILTPSFVPPVYPYEYCAWCANKSGSSSDTMRIEVIKASDGTVLQGVTNTGVQRGFSSLCSIKIANADPIRIKIIFTPGAASHTFWLDWIQFLFSRDCGIYADKATYETATFGATYYPGGYPAQIAALSFTRGNGFTLTDSTQTETDPGTGQVVTGAGLPRGGYALVCRSQTVEVKIDGARLKAKGIDSGCIYAEYQSGLLWAKNSTIECDIAAVSNRMQTGRNIFKTTGPILVEDCDLLNSPNFGIFFVDRGAGALSEIKNNTITQRGIVTERYGISLSQVQNVSIHGNTIAVASGYSGRGIMIDDAGSGHDGDLKDIEVYGNEITVTEKKNLEYPINSMEVPGIRIRIYGNKGIFKNVWIHDNIITAQTGNTDDHVWGAFGIRIRILNPNGYADGSNLVVEDNTIIALNEKAPAGSYYRHAAAIGIDTIAANVWPVIRDNNLESNHHSFWIGNYNDGYALTTQDLILAGNTFIKSASFPGLFTYASIALGGTYASTSRPTDGVFLLDNHYSGGGPTTWTWIDTGWTAGQTGIIYDGWLLDVQGAIPSAAISVIDSLEVTRYEGYADSDGDNHNVTGPTNRIVHTKGGGSDVVTPLVPLIVNYSTLFKSISPTENQIVSFYDEPEPEPWALPMAFVHPRIWVKPAEIAGIQTRIAGALIVPWANLIQHCEGALSRAPSTWAISEAEDLGALAFAYLLDPTRTAYVAKAVEVALYLADLPIAYGPTGRHRALALAMVYDWASAAIPATALRMIRLRIAAYVEALMPTNPQDRLQGAGLLNQAFALAALWAIYDDGTLEQVPQWRSWYEFLHAEFEDGTETSYLAGIRHFMTDGGSHLGAGPGAATTELEGALGRLLPMFEWVEEGWWDASIDWHLWQWRGDRTLHRVGEQICATRYPAAGRLHALQAASRRTGDGAAAALWFADEVAQVEPPAGGQSIWEILWRPAGVQAARPTVAGFGAGGQMKQFGAVGRIVFRDSWEEGGTSVVLDAPKAFLGGRQGRRAGSICLATAGKALIFDKGQSDPAQTETYKVTGSSTLTGHRFSYAQRLPAAGAAIRVLDTNEPTENPLDSFQRLLTADSRYGVLQGDGSIAITNDGGQLAPKNTGYSKERPWTKADLAEAKWAFPGVNLTAPVEDPKFCYTLLDLSPFYYAQKVTTYRRAVLWVKEGAIPGWRRPVLVLVDDLVTHSDPVGAAVQVLQVNVAAAPGTSGSFYTIDRSPSRAFLRVLKPTVTKSDVTGPLVAGVEFPAPASPADWDDPIGVRSEFSPSVATTTPQFVTVLLPCTTAEATPPTVTLIDDATWIGAMINGIECKVRKASPWGATVSTSTDVAAPAVPNGLAATPKTGYVDLDWQDVIASDLEKYRVYRGASGSGPWTLIGEPSVSFYRDEAVVNGTTYYYTVASVDNSGNESAKATAVSATPALGYAGPPWRRPAYRRNPRGASHVRVMADKDYEDPNPSR